MAIKTRNIDMNFTMDKALRKAADIDPARDPDIIAFVGQRESEIDEIDGEVEYFFAAGKGLETLVSSRGNGVCIVYFPAYTDGFIRYFKTCREAKNYFGGIVLRNKGIAVMRMMLVEDGFLPFYCDIVKDYLS